eukprot:8660127-Heterocapsa_arctica.AAC.1
MGGCGASFWVRQTALPGAARSREQPMGRRRPSLPVWETRWSALHSAACPCSDCARGDAEAARLAARQHVRWRAWCWLPRWRWRCAHARPWVWRPDG